MTDVRIEGAEHGLEARLDDRLSNRELAGDDTLAYLGDLIGVQLVLDDGVENDLTTSFDLACELDLAFARQQAYGAHPVEIGLHRLGAEQVGLLGGLAERRRSDFRFLPCLTVTSTPALSSRRRNFRTVPWVAPISAMTSRRLVVGDPTPGFHGLDHFVHLDGIAGLFC